VRAQDMNDERPLHGAGRSHVLAQQLLLEVALAGRAIEAALTDRAGIGVGDGARDRIGVEALVGLEIANDLRVNAERDPQLAVGTAERDQRLPCPRPDRGYEDPRDAGGSRAREDVKPIGIERSDVEVAVSVDHACMILP
jgi:hypothetical protein